MQKIQRKITPVYIKGVVIKVAVQVAIFLVLSTLIIILNNHRQIKKVGIPSTIKMKYTSMLNPNNVG